MQLFLIKGLSLLKIDIVILIFFVNLIINRSSIAILSNFMIYSFVFLVFLVFPTDFFIKDIFTNVMSVYFIYKVIFGSDKFKDNIKMLLCLISILLFVSSTNLFHLYIVFLYLHLIQRSESNNRINFDYIISNLFYISLLVLNLVLTGSFNISNHVVQNEFISNIVLLISYFFVCIQINAFGINVANNGPLSIISKYLTLIIYYNVINFYSLDANFNIFISVQVLSVAALVFVIIGRVFYNITNPVKLKSHSLQYILILIVIAITFKVNNSVYGVYSLVVIDHLLDILIKSKSQIKNIIVVTVSIAIITYIKFTIFIDLHGKMNILLWSAIFSLSSLYFYKLLLHFIKLNEKRVFNKIQESRDILTT